MQVEVVNRDGKSLYVLDYNSLEELLEDWPDAERSAKGKYIAWIGDRK